MPVICGEKWYTELPFHIWFTVQEHNVLSLHIQRPVIRTQHFFTFSKKSTADSSILGMDSSFCHWKHCRFGSTYILCRCWSFFAYRQNLYADSGDGPCCEKWHVGNYDGAPLKRSSLKEADGPTGQEDSILGSDH